MIAGLLLGGTASAATVGGAIGYSLGNNGTTLVRFDNLGLPGMASGTSLTDGAGNSVSLSALDFRPRTREFFGYSNNTNTVYKIDVQTGVATSAASTMDGTAVGTAGFDFNNQIDAARIVSTANDNLVFFPSEFVRATAPDVARFTVTPAGVRRPVGAAKVVRRGRRCRPRSHRRTDARLLHAGRAPSA